VSTPAGGSSARTPLRALVIGAGPAAVMMHLPVLARLRDAGDLVLQVVCDIDAARCAEARATFGFLAVSGDAHAALSRADIDVVYVFGSAQMHYELGLRALESGKHLFVEKPIAPGFAEARVLAAAARRCGRVAVGGHNRRFLTALTQLRAQGGAGWCSAEAVFHKPEFGNRPAFGARSWLGANGIHALDALLFMMGGLPEEVHALAAENAVFTALMRWPGGAQGTFLCNNHAGSRLEEYVFHRPGETCRVTAEGLLIEKGGRTERRAWPMQGDGVGAEHEAFLAAVRSAGVALHDLSALAPSLYVAELIEAGYSGRCRLPEEEGSEGPKAAAATIPSVLVVNPSGLQAALTRVLPAARLVSLAQLEEEPRPRPDIRAALLGRGAAPLTAALLAKLPNLSVVGIVALSVARYDPQALLARGVRIVNASGAYADSVAQFALALAILARRRAFVSHEAMRAGGWGTAYRVPDLKGRVRESARALRPALRRLGFEPLMLRAWKRVAARVAGPAATAAAELRGCRVGLIGWGANACAFARLLHGAGAQVRVYSEHAAAADIIATAAIPATLAEVLACEVVSLHRGLSAATRHALGAAELAQLRPGTVLINLARGALIEPQALLQRLRQGDVFACLDTYETEPLPAGDPLRRLPNVFLTAHIAGGSPQMLATAALEVVEKVAAHLRGAEVTALTAERLGTMT
jgi:phosphoglycerate dehydrogenase-like enzyme/predicted dehydrogenase